MLNAAIIVMKSVAPTMTLEDGSQIMFNMATTSDITLPAGADLNVDGQVDYTVAFDIDTLFTNDTKTKIALAKNLTAGFFSLTLTNPLPPFDSTSTSFGPLIDTTLGVMDELNDAFIFNMGGFNTPTITGAFDLAE